MEDLIFYGGTVKAIGDGKIEGHGIMFTSPKDPDLESDFFSKETDLGVMDGGTVPIYYNHGFDGKLKNRRIGRATVKYDDAGLWLEAQLEMRDDYEKYIYEMAAAGKLGWSSQAAGSLVEREPIGKSWHIKSWPIAEISLTPTPAEPRTHAVPAKSLMENPDIEYPDAAKTAEIVPDEIQPTKSGETEMEKEEIVQLVQDSVKAALEALPAVNAPGIAAPAVKKVTDLGFKDDAVKGFVHWAATGQTNQALIEAKGAWQGQTDNEGGYLVPDDMYAQIVQKRNLQSWVRQAPVQLFTTSRDRILVPTESTAATKMVVTAEEGSYDENEPVFGQVAINIHKMTKLVKVSEELLADNGANLGGYLSDVFARADAKAENYYFTVGSGSGEPQGVLTGATASGITSASATAITAAEAVQVRGTLGSAYHVPGETGWLMQFATKNYIQGLTGNPFQFIPTPAGGADTLLSYPTFISDDMETIAATKKPLMLCNFSFYGVAERAGMVVSRNPYLYEATGQVGFFAKVRKGGAVLQTEAFKYLTQHS